MLKMKRMVQLMCTILTASMLCSCGIKPNLPVEKPFEPTKLPYYVEDTQNLSYSYTDIERIQPYWQGNVMRNEQLMMVQKGDKVEGRLLYKAQKVLSVRDWSLKKEYVEGKDYVVKGDTLSLPSGSTIPIFEDRWSRGENIPAAYPLGNAGTGYQMITNTLMYTETGLIYKNYIHISYVYDPCEVDRTTVKTFSDELLRLSDQLKAGNTIKMAVLGDSISEGCSSSGKWGHEPFCPPYADLVKQGIESLSLAKVALSNISVGGKDSTWGAADEQISKLMSLAPDLLVIGFGTNDSATNIEGKKFGNNIRKMIEAVRIGNANCQIILLAPFPSNVESKSAALLEKVSSTLQSISTSGEYLDVSSVSLYGSCKKMLDKKNYYEIAGNNVNHPNDFITRCYAMNILSAIFDFSQF